MCSPTGISAPKQSITSPSHLTFQVASCNNKEGIYASAMAIGKIAENILTLEFKLQIDSKLSEKVWTNIKNETINSPPKDVSFRGDFEISGEEANKIEELNITLPLLEEDKQEDKNLNLSLLNSIFETSKYLFPNLNVEKSHFNITFEKKEFMDFSYMLAILKK